MRMNELVKRVWKHIKSLKYKMVLLMKKRIFWWTLILIMFLLVYIKLDSPLIALFIIMIPIIQEVFTFLIREKILTKDSSVLWMGIIATFIGFFLSTYATDIQKKQDMETRLKGLIESSLVIEENNLFVSESILESYEEYNEGMLDQYQSKSLRFEPVSLKDNFLNVIFENGDLYVLFVDMYGNQETEQFFRLTQRYDTLYSNYPFSVETEKDLIRNYEYLETMVIHKKLMVDILTLLDKDKMSTSNLSIEEAEFAVEYTNIVEKYNKLLLQDQD